MIRSYLAAGSILDHLARHVREQPDRPIYTFLCDGLGTESLTFRDLWKRVRTLAAHLSEKAKPGDRAVLLYPPGLEFAVAFLACLAAGIIAVPAYPPRKNQKAQRIDGIIADCRPVVILSTVAAMATLAPTLLAGEGFREAVATDAVATSSETRFEMPNHPFDQTAFLQYTSGSTGTPKGVIVTHGNIVANQEAIKHSFQHSKKSVGMSWLPMFHDMGLIGGVLQPVYVGFPVVLMSPTSFLQSPIRWLRAISEYRVSTTGGPNFAFDYTAKNVTPAQMEGLDLSSLRVMFSGAEPVRQETLDRFTRKFGRVQFDGDAFLPCYGLAESTLIVSGGPADAPPRQLTVDPSELEHDRIVPVDADFPQARSLISCGLPSVDTEVAIIDPETGLEVVDGIVGEVCVRSGSVCQGYWNRPKQSAETFQNTLEDREGTYLRTGDLGFMDSGEVFITGRQKDLIITRGRNLYPDDIEFAVGRAATFLGTNGCAAFGLEVDGEERVAVVLEADRSLVQTIKRATAQPHGPDNAELQTLLTRIRQAVNEDCEVMLYAVTIVRPGLFPRTSSGKLRRHACREGMQSGTLETDYSWQFAARKAAAAPASNGC